MVSVDVKHHVCLLILDHAGTWNTPPVVLITAVRLSPCQAARLTFKLITGVWQCLIVCWCFGTVISFEYTALIISCLLFIVHCSFFIVSFCVYCSLDCNQWSSARYVSHQAAVLLLASALRVRLFFFLLSLLFVRTLFTLVILGWSYNYQDNSVYQRDSEKWSNANSKKQFLQKQ